MDVYEFRLQLFLCGRSRNADAKPGRPTGVPAKSNRGLGRSLRVSQLARAPGSKVPRSEIMVRHTTLRSGGLTVSRSPPCGIGADFPALGASRFAVRINGSRAAESDVLPADRHGSDERGTLAPFESQREAVSLPHAIKWQVHDSVLRGPNAHGAAALGACMEGDPRRGRCLAGCARLRAARPFVEEKSFRVCSGVVLEFR